MSIVTQVTRPNRVLLAPPSVTVVICAHTLQRWSNLCAAVLSATVQSRCPRCTVVVIDHNDDLLALSIAQFTPLGVFVLANAHEKGISGARDTGVERADTDIVAFLDDDAIADPDWIEQLTSAYRPGVVGVGGSAIPVWPDQRPRWFPPTFDWVVGCSYVGQNAVDSEVRNFLRCNMSFRREVFDGGRRFATDLGRNGDLPMGCKETELCISVLAESAGRLIMRPEAVVRHHVSSDRTHLADFWRRCFAEGLSKARVASKMGSGAALKSERRYVIRTLPGAVLDGPLHAFTDPWGIARSAVIVLGLALTAAGYLTGVIRSAATRLRAHDDSSSSWAFSTVDRPRAGA